MSIRAERVASEVKKSLVSPISDLASEFSAGLATVTAVRLSKDLQIAKVYLTVFGGKITPGKFIEILEEKNKQIRYQIASKLQLRRVPELRFFLDDTLSEMENIQKLINSVKTTEND